MTTRKYYALRAPYGIATAYGPHHAPTVFIFPNAKLRDAFVTTDTTATFETCTAREAYKHLNAGADRAIVHD